MLPYNDQIWNCDPSYKCSLSFFEVFISNCVGDTSFYSSIWDQGLPSMDLSIWIPLHNEIFHFKESNAMTPVFNVFYFWWFFNQINSHICIHHIVGNSTCLDRYKKTTITNQLLVDVTIFSYQNTCLCSINCSRTCDGLV